MRRTSTGAVLGALALTAGLAGCDAKTELQTNGQQPRGSSAEAVQFADQLRDRVSADAMMGHLRKLQDIADAHGGNRALGTSGYDASVDYVVDALRNKGFDVQTPEFEVRLPFAEDPQVTVAGQAVAAKPLEFTIGTSSEGVSGPLVPARVEDSPGCQAADYDGLPVAGAVVLVDRGACPFADKQAAAAERGAVALIVVNTNNEEKMGGTLGGDTDVKIPVVSVTKADGARLRTAPGPTTLKLTAGVRTERTRNIIAQTKTGSTSDVVMAGAHLDSVPEGPGINDNGSGVAAVLETALQLGSSPEVANAVRFGFWGAEEEGLRGSTNYVESLDLDELKDIALYLNFDMLGSPNAGYFTYDGDQSAPPDERGRPVVPEGSAGIERTLATYLQNAGKTPRDTNFDGRSDYDGFTLAGIPAGGLFSGAEDKMDAEEAKLWAGQVDQPFDPNYHKSADTLEHVNRDALRIHGEGVGFAVGLYAQDQQGRNGLPVRTDRTRNQMTAQ
ncbi:Zn-dependent M28 family amino/carboxypeptidase [Mycobacterium frederiksbergense]|uniref:Zn-dependent M28 family amino/carboxypeptidase n=1 Tax=Mycolicibacterium frederiksbergense TaxID=117567 RepID=A0ABT6L538_9MYCO|nr:M28 family metallopeptidase [Mycolicibacterium frederiksbergense]MDH6198074.1 Zn-dependent M28 family amino/carboxypeptidase [Mycolicibacterium frederiksbergense]